MLIGSPLQIVLLQHWTYPTGEPKRKNAGTTNAIHIDFELVCKAMYL